MLAYKLQRIAVAGNKQRVNTVFVCHARKGAEYVVRFIAWALAHGYAHLGQQVAYKRKLGAQFVRNGLSAGLVFAVFFMPECRAVHIKSDQHIFRFLLSKLQQHA